MDIITINDGISVNMKIFHLQAQMKNLMSTAPPGAREQLEEILESLVPPKEQTASKDITNKNEIQVEKRRRKNIQQQKNVDEVALATAKQLKKFGVNCLAREFSPEQHRYVVCVYISTIWVEFQAESTVVLL